jgi:hypothetical protein
MCAGQCVESSSCGLCAPPCVTAIGLDDCDAGCQPTGCCALAVSDGGSRLCVESDALSCVLAQGEFHSGEKCRPERGQCEPEFCCRCTGDNPDACGGGQCVDDCASRPPPDCPAETCVRVITTGTCDGDGCKPTGCCSQVIRDQSTCIESDAKACEFVGGTFFAGGMCDPASGECQVPSQTPTSSPTMTPTMPTATPSSTPTATPTMAPTSTRVPEGGSCMNTSQCAPALLCVDGVCTAPSVPAPATSRSGLLMALGVLVVIAAGSLHRFATRGR